MPMYEYACDSCNLQLEVEQSMKDDPITICPECKGALRRVFSPNSIIFKGSGFYSTDSRAACEKPKAAESSACATCPAAATAGSSSS